MANQDHKVQFIQINSFGCGPDSIVIDENTEILKAKGKALTLIRVDEITSTGSVRLAFAFDDWIGKNDGNTA